MRSSTLWMMRWVACKCAVFCEPVDEFSMAPTVIVLVVSS